MAPTPDPWRTLGLTRGATPDEVRRAYRRLAKINHPDAAGESALPRFLAIQAAYEQLAGPTTGRGGRAGSRPSSGSGSRPSAPREPWRADPDRARASGRADGRRTPGARPTGGGGPGPGPGGFPEGDSASAGGTGSAGAAGAAGKSRRSSGRKRPPNKATPGSTSYEGADEEPFEPGWSGGTWYGASSGTYWTINPKEYADPRKHGPEYQARGRRRAGPSTGPGPAGAEAAASSGADAHEPDSEASPPQSDRSPEPNPAPRPTSPYRPPPAPPGRSPGEASFGRARAWVDQPPPDAPLRLPLLRPPTSALGRLVAALLGWPPLGIFAAAAIDGSTGCGRFAASCPEISSPGTWIVHAALILLLIALPRFAAWSAHGTVAAFIVGVPAAVVLSAGGGARQPEASASVLLAITAGAWIVGVLYAVAVPRMGRGPAE